MHENANSMTVDQLRDAGFCVVVFNPTELQGLSPRKLSDCLIEKGNEWISTFQPEELDQSNFQSQG